MELKGKKVAVVGMGITGRAVAEFLLKKGAQVYISEKDSTKEKELRDFENKGALVELGGHSRDFLSQADFIVVSPGVDWNEDFLAQLRSEGKEVLPEIDFAFPFIKGKIVAVTGSNGKSTTASLVHHLLINAGLKSILAGNIGKALISVAEKEADFFVVEVSSFQLEGSRLFSPYVAILLNCTPDHLDRHLTMESYCGAKERLLENQMQGLAVLNYEDPRRSIWERKARAEVLYFSSRRRVKGLYLKGEKVFWHDGRYAFDSSRLSIKGLHNVENAMASYLAAHYCGASPEKLERALYTFQPLEHRMEIFLQHKGVVFVNDSKATNVDSVKRALEGVKNPVILILGGKDKGTSFGPLADLINEKVKLLITIGQAAERIEKELKGKAPMRRAGSMEEAVEIAIKEAKEGDWVMLSPACASFDMFKNFEERGRIFKELVRRKLNV